MTTFTLFTDVSATSVPLEPAWLPVVDAATGCWYACRSPGRGASRGATTAVADRSDIDALPAPPPEPARADEPWTAPGERDTRSCRPRPAGGLALHAAQLQVVVERRAPGCCQQGRYRRHRQDVELAHGRPPKLNDAPVCQGRNARIETRCAESAGRGTIWHPRWRRPPRGGCSPPPEKDFRPVKKRYKILGASPPFWPSPSWRSRSR